MKGDNRVIHIAVRSLVEFVLRSGSLETQAGPSSEAAMLEGARIHRKLQKKEGEGYQAEVPLRIGIPVDGGTSSGEPAGTLCLEGRADGIFRNDGRTESVSQGIFVIDEIKTVLGSIRGLDKPVEVHLAQAQCYAFIYAREQGLERIGIRMTYCSQTTEEVRCFYEEMTFQELESRFRDLIGAYMPWAKLRLSSAGAALRTIRQMQFPFPYREGQRDLAAGVYRTIARGRKLFLQAPTGTGKTMAVLFPALKAVGEGRADRVWYLTAKAVTGRAALEALGILQRKGLCIRSVVLASKERVCPCGSVDCRAAACPRADGHFDRVNEALWALLQGGEKDGAGGSAGVPVGTETLAAAAEKYSVCPYELAMDAAEWADVIIGDYNYVFHPQARLSRLLDGGRPVLLVDEAHNLLERGRDMYSAGLSLSGLRDFRRSIRSTRPRLWKKLRDPVRAMRIVEEKAVQEAEPVRGVRVLHTWEEEKQKLAAALDAVRNEMQWILEQEQRSGGPVPEENFLEFYFLLSRFQQVLDAVDGQYIVYTTGKGPESFALHLFCADPSLRLRESMEKTVSAVFFSATFLPIQYYKGLLGGTPEDYEMYARSSFSPARQIVLISGDVTSRYRDRSRENYRRIADRIGRIASCRPGNYMVFFPSYAFLESVLEAFRGLCAPPAGEESPGEEDIPTGESGGENTGEKDTAAGDAGFLFRETPFSPYPVRVLAQKSRMDEEARASFLAAFDEMEAERHLIGFCVLGGMFGEGIDLRDDRLIGCIVVGTGLPPVEPERELLKEYFSGTGRNGFDYAYRFPGMNKVLQAAGRVIRTEQDRGIVALLDGRFAEPRNRELFPVEWGQPEALDGDGTAARIRSFWASVEKT